MFEKLKKLLSFFLIFLILFNISFQLPLGSFFGKTNAENTQYSDLVTIFVENAVWKTGARSVIERYANDISKNLENTKVLMLPVPIDASAFKIASINEKFYFEWLWGERNLVWSVFIGDIPIPVVHDNDDFSRSIFPYVDFRDKGYIYNQISQKYEKNEKRVWELKAEIWHGFISPNSSEYSKWEWIVNYFNKNHEFYLGKGKFDPKNGLMSGNKDQKLHEDYVPEVFYFDQVRESQSLNYSNYKGYLAAQTNFHEDEKGNVFRNKEDLAYNRFSKPFAEYLQNQVLGKDQEDIESLLEDVVAANPSGAKTWQAIDLIQALSNSSPVESNGLSNPNIWDIQARNTILNIAKKFVEVFSPGMTWELRENVRNAWRYSNTWSSVNVDSIPFIISHIDSISDSFIKSVNTKLESEIDALVMTWGLSRNIAVPTKMAHLNEPAWLGFWDASCSNYKEFTNFLDGTKWNYINSAADCSAYFGNSDFWGQLVQANRWLNVNHVAKSWENGEYLWSGNPTGDLSEYLEFHGIDNDEGDTYKDSVAEMCPSNEKESTYWYWWGNTPLNLDIWSDEPGQNLNVNERILKLREWRDLDSSITRVRDIRGAELYENTIERWDEEGTIEYPNYENEFFVDQDNKNPSPLHCLDNNYILTRSIGEYVPKFVWWLTYDNPTDQVFTDNLYYWNDYENVPLKSWLWNFKVFNPFLWGDTISIRDQFSDNREAKICVVDYNLPMLKPNIELNPQSGFSQAFNPSKIAWYNGWNQVFTQTPITAGEYIWIVGGDQITIPENQDINVSLSETANWSCDSRNVKLDLDFTFDYVYRKIHEAAEAGYWDVCNYSSAYLYGNVDIFSPWENDEMQESPYDFFETIEEQYVNFTRWTEKTFTGWYLSGSYYEDLDKVGSRVVAPALWEETIISELVKSNYEFEAWQNESSTSDGSQNSEWGGTQRAYTESCPKDIVNYFYKEIPSYVEHKSPEPYELYSQIKHKVTPNLPIDKDRYIDFIAANNTYQKILYPYLFRVELPRNFETQNGGLEQKLERVDEEIKKILDQKSNEINEVIVNSNPETLTDPIDIEIYEHLKVADFNDEKIDLYKSLQEIESTEIMSFQDQKDINYYDFLVFAVYWNNLKSIPAKYKFVMEQYLSDQYQRPELEFLVPKNKKQYEIAYLWAPGNAQEMYVSLDPEKKWDNPFADIIYDNVELGTQLFSSNVYGNNGQSDFECAPPGWVPLWEWPSALSCWLKGFENPKINFSENSCSQKTLFLSPEEEEALKQCGWDFDKNWVEDCVQYSVPDGTIDIYSDSPSYYYNSTGKITVVIKDVEGNPIKYDSASRINMELVSIESKSGEQIDDESDFVSYNFVDTRNSFWEANFYFTWKDKDVDLVFRATLELKDSHGDEFAKLESEELRVEIRGDRLFATSYKLSEKDQDIWFEIWQERLTVSRASNIFVSDEFNFPVSGREDELAWKSEAKEKMVLSLSNFDNNGDNIAVNYPVNIQIFQWIDELQDDVEQVFSEFEIWGAQDFMPLTWLSETGFYRFIITDAAWIKYSRVVQLVPDEVTRMELNLSTNISETWKVHTPHIFTLYDQYDNIADSDFYTINARIEWEGATFDNLKKSKTFTTYEWFQAFKLISENSGWKSTLIFSLEWIETSELFHVVDSINLNIEPQFQELKVWWGIYNYEISVDGGWIDVSDLNTSLYVSTNDVYLEPLEPFFDIRNGKAQIKLATKKSSGIDIPIEFQAYGFRDAYREEQTIFHEEAIKIDISLDKEKIEASPDWVARLSVELKDRFWNVAFSDNSSEVQLALKDKVARFFSPEDIDTPQWEHLWSTGESIIIDADALVKNVEAWRTTFELRGTNEPGLAYFTVAVPSIEWTSYRVNGQAPFSSENLEIEWFAENGKLNARGELFFDNIWNWEFRSKYLFLQDLQSSTDFQKLDPIQKNTLRAVFQFNNTLTIKWVWKNAWMIETYYFWKAEALKDNFYNSLYTTLIGSNYGDIQTEDYLAGGILFDPENRGLAVTTLLQNPYKTDGVFRIGKQSSLRKVASNEDLAQDLVPSFVLSEDATKVTLNNQSINTNVGDVYYNFDPNITDLKVCEIGEDIDSCSDEGNNTEIIFHETSLLYNAIQKDNALILLDISGEEIFRIDRQWIIEKDIGVQLNIDFDTREKFLKVDVGTVDGEAGTLFFNFNDDTLLHVTKDSQELANYNALGNSIVFHMKTNYYEAKMLPDTGIEVVYRDLFNSSRDLENFVEDTPYWYERFDQEGGIWFTGTNKTLLSFASGKSVWEASKDYHSFYMINLWDPVLSLKKKSKKLPFSNQQRNFDSTIWEIITRENDIVDYNVWDYNNDGREDIFIQKNTGYIKLLENTSWATKFIDRGNLLYIADIWSSSVVEIWDFDGNGYSDVFLVNTKGQPAIFMNDLKKYTRYDLEEEFWLNGKITQAEVFDMDIDGKHDIVVLDESWQINIFFWVGWTQNPSFQKRTVEEWIGATLSQDLRNNGAAVYFDWLLQSTQWSTNIISSQEQEELLAGQEKVLELTQDSQIDFEAFCMEIPACKAKIFRANWIRIVAIDSAQACAQTPGCIESALEKTLDSAIQLWEKWEYISERELEGELFITLPYQSHESREEELAELTNSEIASLVTWNFPEFEEETHPNVQAWIDFSQKQISEYIRNSRPENLSYQWEINSTQTTTFIKSEYAEVAWMSIKKYYSDNDGWYLKSWDNVEAKVVLKNVTDSTLTDIVFVDSIPNGFIIDPLSDFSSSREWLDMKNWVWGFDYMLEWFSLAAGAEITITFMLISPTIKVWYLEVWIFENSLGTNDGQGDIKIKSRKNTCGASETLYMSPWYAKTERVPNCDNSNISGALDKHLTDENQNGVPDYIDAMLDWGDEATNARQEYSQEQLTLLDFDSDLDGLPDRDDASPHQNTDNISFLDKLQDLDDSAAKASEKVDEIIQWLWCWFWGWSCIASPLNWAPLAPGNDPTLFGMPIGDWLRVNEGVPVFSALTGIVVPVAWCIPTVWPLSPLSTSWCSSLWAGWYLWTNNSANFIRVFVTPTLTGASWVAVCFWWPASAAGNSNPPWVHPIVPGGNCIVTAMPLPLCSNDGSDGDPSYIGRPEVPAWSNFSIIGGNCEAPSSKPETIDPEIVRSYLSASQWWGSFTEDFLELIKSGKIARWKYWKQSNTEALIQWGQGEGSFDLGFSVTGEDGFVFEDVEKISMKKVNPFPDFLAWWWERQIWEIANKLTDFPGIYIILPDMSWFMQSWWGNLSEGLKEHFNTWVKDFDVDQLAVQDKISDLENDMYANNCYLLEEKDLQCRMLEWWIEKLKQDNGTIAWVTTWVKAVQQKGKWYMSWIKAAYQFLSSLPLISVEPEKVLVTIPWVDESTLKRATLDWKQTKKQWTQEISWLWIEDAEFNSNANRLFSSLDKNLEILEHYAQLPVELGKLLQIKELRLEQVLCNIDAVNEMLSGRISRNGKRFKAWVELSITIKAILKSWQLIIDVFYEYDAACHECKNERQDLYYFVFKLVSLVIPEIPIIQFPRYPDIVLDLHNIKAGIVVSLPDIELRPRPIVLPPLPRLYLPSVPSAWLSLPQLPLLDDYTIPQLPELPSIPHVDLPDLPPPPKLPKIFSELEGALSILKLVVKVMCILKSSPFVPEWRAGDQIAFITERTGYLPSDFIDLSISTPSYSFVDSINVSSYVNYEYETDYVVEATRSALLPFNSFTTDVSKKINRRIPDFNLEQYTPEDIDVNINSDGTIDSSLESNADVWRLVMFMSQGITGLLSYVEKNARDEVESKYFTKRASESLNKKWIIQDPMYNELRGVWQSVQEYDYKKEDAFIENLQRQNSEKFQTVRDIIHQEKILHEKQIQEVKNIGKTPLSYSSEFSLVSQENERFTSYQKQLEKYNNYTGASLLWIYESKNIEQEKLEEMANSIVASMGKSIEDHRKLLAKTDPTTLFTHAHSSAWSPQASGGTCSATKADKIHYKWIYVLEEETPYRLFDYTEEMNGNEEQRYTDYDNDGDVDILYMVNGVIFLKENLETQSEKLYNPGVEFTNFRDSDEKFEAVNGFREIVENGFVNITFNAHTNRKVNAYRLEFYDRIDAFDNAEQSNPDDYQKVTIDAFARLDELTLENDNDFYTLRKNIWRITNASIVPWLEVESDQLASLWDLLLRDTSIEISKGTKLYTGKQWGTFQYYYKADDTQTVRNYSLSPYSNIEFKESIIIVPDESIAGTIYTKTKIRRTYRGSEVIQLVHLPLLENTIIRLTNDEDITNERSNIEIIYYDDSVSRIDFSVLKKYEILNLWPEQEEYFIKTSMENAFYYARFRPFLSNNFWTAVKTVLMSPQNEIDSTPPELDYSGFRIPVYKERVFDLTPYIYEDEGIRWIQEMYIDADLEVDSDQNWNPSDDRDIQAEWVQLERSLSYVRLRFWPFDDLVRKKIKVIMIDHNDNIWEKILDMEVYAPIPDISYGDRGEVRWLLRENIDGEPISLFRYRWGVLSKLKDISWSDTNLSWLNGEYKFRFPVWSNSDSSILSWEQTNQANVWEQQSSSLTLQDSGKDIIKINGNTGKIDLLDPLLKVEVLASNNVDNPWSNLSFVFLKWWKQIYSQSFWIIWGYTHVVPDFDTLGVEGMYVKMREDSSEIYWHFKTPETAPVSPWAIGIYYLDDPYEPLFTIQKDGKIFVKDENYVLQYSVYEDYSILKLFDKLKNIVAAEVLIKPWEDFRLR